MTRLIGILLFPVILGAQAAAGPRVNNGATVSVPMQIALSLTLLTLLPAFIMCVTPFLRITIVLHFLRQALGTQTTPSNQVLLGLSLFLTVPLVYPVGTEIHRTAWQPMQAGTMTQTQALEEAGKPLRQYLLKFAREKDIRMLVETSGMASPRNAKEISLSILIPAYILSELKTGFQIGAVLFLPFLVIDLVVASVTVSVGMVQLPPVMLSAPFKVLLFVLVDGWNLVIGSLLKTFSQT